MKILFKFLPFIVTTGLLFALACGTAQEVPPTPAATLYLVSNAFEPAKKTPLLGMEKFHGLLDGAKKPRVLVASDGNEKTDSETHGGFDNDEKTMNSVLRAILGGPPKRPFTRLELSY